MARKEKEQIVDQLTAKLKSNNGVVLTEYQGLTVAEIIELRNKLRPYKCEYRVVKNTLTKRALKEVGLEDFSKYFSGPTALAIEQGDPVETAKILFDFSKDHKKFKLKSGLMGKKVLSVNDLQRLSELPPRNVLLAQLLGTMNSPLTGLMTVLQGNTRKLMNVLAAIEKQKEAK